MIQLNDIKKKCLVIDVETSAIYPEGDVIDLTTNFEDYVKFAKVKWLGMYSYLFDAYSEVNVAETDLMIIQNYIAKDAIIIGFNNEEFDTPIMYNVKNKKLTAQTARFPARSYWLESGKDRFILRYASDFLLFDLFSQMNLKPQYFPLRAYEFEQYDFRREQEGELSGLRRLRGFIMPDLHTLCKDLDSSVEEFIKQYELIKNLEKDLGINGLVIFRATQEFYKKNKSWIINLIKSESSPCLLELWEDRYYYYILKFERNVLSANNKSATLATNQIDIESSLEYMVDNDGIKRQKYNISFKDVDGVIKHPIILHNSPTGGLERVIWGLIELYESSFDIFYLKTAVKLNELLIKYFWDEENSGFYFTDHDNHDTLNIQVGAGNKKAIVNEDR